ncbi:hypothetical protein [Mesorhizobium sp. dw_380]|nr:hypothetical protein [Mesorhizobium sp. dw_380]
MDDGMVATGSSEGEAGTQWAALDALLVIFALYRSSVRRSGTA